MPKLGYVTGSLFKKMMTKGRAKDEEWGVTSLGLAKEIAAQRFGILELDLDGYTDENIEHGNEYEAEAIAEYERAKGFVQVTGRQDFIQHYNYEWVGVHPDGRVDGGAIEVKCPKSSNHIDNLLDNAQLSLYKWQIHGTMWCDPAIQYVDFVSYDPRMEPPYNLHIHRVERDEEIIKEMDERYQAFELKVDEYTKRLKELV